MKRSDISTVAVTASHGVMHAYLVVLPALMPLMAGELGNLAFLGYLASLVTLFYGWGSFPVGFLADVISRKKLIMLSMIICGIATAIVGLSGNIWLTAAGMILVGLGASLYHPPGYAHMALLSSEMRGRFMGIQGIGGDMGMAIAYITSAALGVTLGWRNTFILWGGVGLLMAVADLLVVEDVPADPADKSVPRGGYLSTVKQMFTTDQRTNIILVLAVVMLSGGLWSGVSQWILTYINKTKGVSLLIAGGLSTIQYTVGAFAQITGGELSDRIGRKGILVAGFAAFAVSLVAMVLAPGNIIVLLVLVGALGFTFYVTQAPISALLADITPKNTVGVTYGINFTVKYGIGVVLPIVAAWLSSNYGLDSVFYFFAACSAAAVLILLPVKERKKQKK
ncbi:MAG: MFS transporter [Candidatus Bathyarchaeota archaeon]|nr:MFS transporter [Candidatus Bathyarchaeota archaeon]